MCLSIPAQIVEIVDLDERRVRVDAVGVVSEVPLALPVGEAGGPLPGDWVLLYHGRAIASIEPDEGRARIAALREIFPVSD